MAEQNVVIKIKADVSKATNDVKALQFPTDWGSTLHC